MKRFAAITALALALCSHAEPPDIEYIYPAGAQRGTAVPVRIGGYYFHGQANFEMLGSGVKFQTLIKSTKTIWFEGPLIYQPLSQRPENYPKDHLNQITVAKDAEIGQRLWRCWTSQGVTKTLKFVIGNLPEVMENEIDGRPIPQSVILPVTANGRIFPREDIDIWAFTAKAGETIVIDAAAKRFGSPLNVVLSVRDAKGNPVATNKTLREGDPIHWFKAPSNGSYEVHIHDAKFGGLQNHIYRLTLKRGPHILSHYPLGGRRGSTVQAEFYGPALPSQRANIALKNAKSDIHFAPVNNWGTAKFVISDHPEQLEEKKSAVTTPVVINGRIKKPGESDEWKIKLEEKQKIILDLAAAQLGSPLDAVLSLHDAEDKQQATNDDRAKNQADPRLQFTAKAAGEYTIKVRDRFASRGGPNFVYRLTATTAVESKPDFALTLDRNFLNLTRLTEPPKADAKPAGPKLKVSVSRTGGFKGEITLKVGGLPPNVTVHHATIATNKNDTSLQFTVPPRTKIHTKRLTITGIAKIGEKDTTRTATAPETLDHLLCGFVPSVPFKHKGVYRIITGLPGGTTFHRKYTIDRGGFTGPINVSLAEKQGRHLQGVIDHLVTVPKNATDFAFPVKFPARIEIGRTSRVCVMLVGELTDFDGTKHKISYTSSDRDEQLISVAADGLVAVQTAADSFTVPPSSEFTIPVTIRREPAALKQPMKVELIQPQHIEGIFSDPVDLAPGEVTVSLKIQTADSPGPFNTPFRIRASTTGGPRRVGEKLIEFVAPQN